MRRYALAAVLLLAASLPAWSAKTGIDVVEAYAGTWSVETDHLDTAHSKASHETSTLRNDCWKSPPYLVCNQFVNGDSKALLVFTYDAAADRYTSYPIPSDGSSAGSGTLQIRGNTWTFPWQVKDGPSTIYYRVVNVFTTADTIDYRQEFSAEQEHWTVTARGHERRIAAASVR